MLRSFALEPHRVPRARLVALLAKHRPAGLLLLSGDVHFAEMSGRRRPDGSPPFLLEATSSGMNRATLLSLVSRGRPHLI